MSEEIRVPSPDQIKAQIAARRAEITALKRLLNIANAQQQIKPVHQLTGKNK